MHFYNNNPTAIPKHRMCRVCAYPQGDLERAHGREVSPLCDRSASGDARAFGRGQQGFIDYVVAPKVRLAEIVPLVRHTRYCSPLRLETLRWPGISGARSCFALRRRA